jgi:flagellar FliJ protein
MTRSKRLQPIAEVEHGRERDAAREVGRCQQALEELRAQLTQLNAYREEYSRKFVDALHGGLGVTGVQEYRLFLARLDQAIVEQERKLDAGHRAYEATRERWLETRRRAEAMDKVMENCRAEELKTADRIEQRELDERAARGPGGHSA